MMNNNDNVCSISLRDWTIEQGEMDPATAPEALRLPYRVKVTRVSGNGGLCIEIAREDGRDSPAMEVMVEVNKGVPCLHVGNSIFGDNKIHVFAVPEGIAVVPDGDERPEWVRTSRFYDGCRDHNTSLYR
jgi:hypothetical protein